VTDSTDVAEGMLVRPDGRKVAWTEWSGDEVDAERVLLRFPGTPGSRWTAMRADRAEVWGSRRLRVITTERPGFGRSSRLPGRRFSEHADDLAAVLDHLGVERAYVVGASGAAPHILSFLSRHPGRARAATIMVGAAPVSDDEVGAMIELNQQAHRLAKARDREGSRALLAPHHAAMRADPIASIRAIMETAPPDDQAVMSEPAWQEMFGRATREAMAQDVEGWIDEGYAITNDWDEIDLSAIRTSIGWYHGEHDRNVPLSAALRLLERLPTATTRVWPDVGHLYGYRIEPEILDELLARG
jgi:pimeloyl-ACP methyl ester carboxylesterase